MAEGVYASVDTKGNAGERSSAFRLKRPSFSFLWGLIVPIVVIAGLEAAVAFGFIQARMMPPPSEILQTMHELFERGLLTHISASTLRVAAGYSIAVALAIPIGALVGLSMRAESILDPTFQALRAIPGLAWVPLLLLWLGIDEWPKITLIAIGSFFPVYLGVIAGIRNVDRKLVEVGEMYGIGYATLVRRILLPGALPSIFTGLRQGLSLGWMCLVAAELIAATRGLGYLLTDGREVSRPDIVIASIILLALLGKFSDTILKSVETRALHWRDTFAAKGA